MQRITPFLWYDGRAEEAAKFYTSIFKNSKIERVTLSGSEGTVMSVVFQLDGQEFYALNGGPQFTFTPAISFFVNCENQEEVDYFWDNLSLGGEEQGPGWVKDQFGVSWQVVPSILNELLNDPDPERSGRVMQAMMQMTKIEIEKLKQAYEG
jgi:predicted 3-demethylubiquinone-9 3-methyltransferase (glyoxalase superfamily)